jgi:hypothetical protein
VPTGIQVLIFAADLDCLIVAERVAGAERNGANGEQEQPMMMHEPPEERCFEEPGAVGTRREKSAL